MPMISAERAIHTQLLARSPPFGVLELVASEKGPLAITMPMYSWDLQVMFC